MQNQSAQADASGREVPLTGSEYVADIHYDEHGLPKTLFDWRWEQKRFWSTARHIWEQLESFFEVFGYILFVTNKRLNCTYGPPQPDALRPPDNYHCVLPEDQTGHKVVYISWSNKYIPAVRKVDGTHVMIQLVCKGNEGRTELDIMRFFNHPERRHDPRNHTLPILDELQLRDMVFVVVPLLREGLIEPWFFNLGEALDAMHQSFTALAFLHHHSVAHRDLGISEFLINYGGSTLSPMYKAAAWKGAPFRSLFPCRYYIIDLEYAIRMEGGNGDMQTEEGHPVLNEHINDVRCRGMRYAKAMPPEWILPAAYCPFKSDVYQLGKAWEEVLDQQPHHQLQGVQQILADMSQEDAGQRPTMQEALALLGLRRGRLLPAQLESKFT